MSDLLGSATPFVYERLKILQAELANLLDKQIRANADLRELIRQHPIEVKTLFKGAPSLDEMVATGADMMWQGYDPPSGPKG